MYKQALQPVICLHVIAIYAHTAPVDGRHSATGQQLQVPKGLMAVGLQVDVVGKSSHMLAVPMLGRALYWTAKLKGDVLAQPLLSLLADCCLRLRNHYAQFILDRVCLHCGQVLYDVITVCLMLHSLHSESCFPLCMPCICLQNVMYPCMRAV